MQNENPVSHAPLPDRAIDAIAQVTVSAAGLNLITRNRRTPKDPIPTGVKRNTEKHLRADPPEDRKRCCDIQSVQSDIRHSALVCVCPNPNPREKTVRTRTEIGSRIVFQTANPEAPPPRTQSHQMAVLRDSAAKT
jgi:hypothetical protein